MEPKELSAEDEIAWDILIKLIEGRAAMANVQTFLMLTATLEKDFSMGFTQCHVNAFLESSWGYLRHCAEGLDLGSEVLASQYHF